MNDHDRIEELIAVGALGGLDDEGRRDLEQLRREHDPDCAECLRLETDYAEVSGRLAFAVDPIPVPPRMAHDILERAAVSDRAPSVPPPGSAPGWSRRAVLALAAVVAVLAGAVGGYLVAPRGSSEGDLRALLAQPGSRVVQFSGTGSGNLAMAYLPGEDTAYVFGNEVSEPPDGKVYELWMMYDDERAPTPVTTFEGGETLVLEVGRDPSTSDAMGVTVEEGFVQAPTTTPIWTAPVEA